MSERIKSLVLLDLDTGAWKDGRLPLHVKVTPPFLLSEEEVPEFGEEFDMALRSMEEFKIETKETAWYGDNNDMLARRLGGKGLYLLHQIAMQIASNYDDNIPDKYMYEDYSPHVTFKDGHGPAENKRILVRDVTFATKRDVWRPERQHFLYKEADNER